jgi:hypothetical protein
LVGVKRKRRGSSVSRKIPKRGLERGVAPASGRFSHYPETERMPALDMNQYMDNVWGGTKVRVEATIDHDLYAQIQHIIEKLRAAAAEGDFPAMSISHIIEMLLRKGVKHYLAEQSETSKK